jgi:hypothetical protein
VSKSPKDRGDWRSGSEALFRAARVDHDASAADCARVEAELARRIAAGAPAKVALGDKQEIVAKLARAWTPGTIAKLWIGVALLAAGSLALMLAINFRPAGSASPQPASVAPPAPANDRAPDIAPKEPVSSPISELPDAPRLREPARHEGPARVAPPRPPLRDSAPPKRPTATRSASASADSKPAAPPIAPTPASIDTDSHDEELSAQPAPSRGTSLKQPDPKTSARPLAAVTLETPPAAAEANARTQTRPVLVRVDASADARAELALVERMHAAMREAKPADALELCAEHAERWPRGVFTEEREAVRAIASCVLRSDDAASRARLFLSNHPHAPTAPRVAAACAPLSAAKGPEASQ